VSWLPVIKIHTETHPKTQTRRKSAKGKYKTYEAFLIPYLHTKSPTTTRLISLLFQKCPLILNLVLQKCNKMHDSLELRSYYKFKYQK
jgi:hypothetical protein